MESRQRLTPPPFGWSTKVSLSCEVKVSHHLSFTLLNTGIVERGSEFRNPLIQISCHLFVIMSVSSKNFTTYYQV